MTPMQKLCENPHMLRTMAGARRLVLIAAAIAFVTLVVWLGGRIAGADAEADHADACGQSGARKRRGAASANTHDDTPFTDATERNMRGNKAAPTVPK